jgi:hypothetical protein
MSPIGTSLHYAACRLLVRERTCRGGEGDVNDPRQTSTTHNGLPLEASFSLY